MADTRLAKAPLHPIKIAMEAKRTSTAVRVLDQADVPNV